MKQDHFGDEEEADPSTVHIYFREIQSGDLNNWTFEHVEEVKNINKVIQGLDRKTKSHDFSQVKLDPNPEMFVNHLLDAYPNFMEEFCKSLVNNFSQNMMTRARESGKYAVLIVSRGRVIICHTDSEELSLSKEAEVIERLLDTDNVTKYAKFTKSDEGITVHEYERNQRSKSFSEWIGLDPEQIAYDDAGEIKIASVVDDSTTTFEYDLEEFEDKFLEGEAFKLVGEFLYTAKGNKYPVKHLNLGRKKFDTVDEFKQEYHALYYDLHHYRSHYEDINYGIAIYSKKHVDHESKVTNSGAGGETLILKEHGELNILYANKSIELEATWRHKLSEKFRDGERVRLHHAGVRFSENPVLVGPFEFYNEFEFDEVRINQLYDITTEVGSTGHLSNIIYSVMLSTLSRWTESPISDFFEQMAEPFDETLEAEGIIVRGEDTIVEYKSRDWVVEDDNDSIARKITEDIQADSKLLLVGIEDDEQRIRPVKSSNFGQDRREYIKESLVKMNGHESIELASLPLSGEECLLFVYSIRGDQEFDFGLPG